MYDVVVIGAGVAGTCIARELSRYQLKVLLLDQESDVANETTMANSAIIHAGYDAKAGLLKGRFNAPGNAMFDQICDELDVPFIRCGSLVIGFDENDRAIINKLYENGLTNKVPHMCILDKEEVHRMEPNVNEKVCCALYAPTTGIISPWELAIALAENAIDNGTELQLETKVQGIKRDHDNYQILSKKEMIETRYVINCAGVYADQINNMVTEPYFDIHPRKGHYFVLDKDNGDFVNHVIFQCPSTKGKGVIVTPTVHGNVLIGPDSEFVDDKECLSTDSRQLEYIKQSGFLPFPSLPYHKIIRSFSGLRATSDTGDFMIEEAKGAKGFINVACFDSPGLSSIPAVALYVVKMLEDIMGSLTPKDNFNPRRRKVIRFNELSQENKKEITKENPLYGNIICRCETVTEAEIIDAIHRNAGARTVKGVKKRTRPGTGRCQGSFCGPRVVEILARELGKDMKDITYDSNQAYILTEETKCKHEFDS